MYDPQDSLILEERFLEQIYHREEIANLVCSGLSLGHTNFSPTETVSEHQISSFLVFNKINVTSAKKMARDDIVRLVKQNQGKLLYSDFSKIILDF